jgi:PAS domain S-box-containing protein
MGQPATQEQEVPSAPNARLRIRYILALGLIAVLTLVSHRLTYQLLEAQSGDPSLINQAGRQRMLSQALAKLSLQIQATQDPQELRDQTAQLRLRLESWSREHERFVHDTAHLGLPGTRDPSEFTLLFSRIDPARRAIEDAARGILAETEAPAVEPIDHQAIENHVRVILEHESQFLTTWDEMVSLYEMTARRRQDLLRTTLQTLLAVTLLALFVAAVLVFEPAVRLIQRQFAEKGRLLATAESARNRTDELSAVLQRREERYRALVENAQAIMIEVDDHARVLYVSPNVKDLLGYEATTFVGTEAWEMVHPEDVAAIAETYRKALEGGGAGKAEVRIRHKDGSWRWFESVGRTYQAADGKTHVVTISSDISERRRAEETTRVANEQLRNLVTHSPVILFAIDRNGTVTRCDGKGLLPTGLTPQDLVGRTVSEIAAYLFPPGSPIEEYFARALRGEEFTVALPYNDLTFETRYTPVRDSSGNPEGLIGVATNITERLRTDQERERLKAQVEHSQKLESLGVLAGGIAHDFNNLLTVVLGGAELAMSDLAPGDPARRSIGQIRDAGRRAADLTNQLLAYAGRGQITVEPVDLSELIGGMEELLKVSISKKAVLRSELAEGLPRISGDAGQISQVVLNLITNASEALGDEKGVIKVVTDVINHHGEYRPNTYPPVGLTAGTYAYLSVRDSGEGMDPETEPRVFEPFFTTKASGRGLGLSAVLGIVQAHAGAVSIETELGAGTTFQVLFPVLEGVAEREAERSKDEPQWRGRGTVLLVDDEEEVRSVAAKMLEKLGFRVVMASDGREGLETFRRCSDEIAAVLLDMTMPELSGTEVLRQLRGLGHETRVLLMSGYTEEGATSPLTDPGPIGFLHKPFTLAELREALQRLLKETGQRPTL